MAAARGRGRKKNERGNAMEFSTLAEAQVYAQRAASLTNEPRFILCGSGERPYWVCGPFAKSQLWPDREPVAVCNP
jgi:hypothetical protein